MAGVAWQEQLRSRGYRLTPARQLVLEAVDRLGHATPDGIAAEVRRTASAVNVSTVYRTLDLLEGLGLVTHTHLGHGAPTYHTAADEGHVHLVCRACGAISEVGEDAVASMVGDLAREHGFAVDVGHLTIFGVCRGCTAAGAVPSILEA